MEVPLFTDATITGNIESGLGPYQLLNALSMMSQASYRPAIFLRLWDHRFPDSTRPDFGKTDAKHYHGGDLADEVAALASLCMGIRLKAGSYTRLFGEWVTDPLGRPFVSAGMYPEMPFVGRTPIIPRCLGEGKCKGDIPANAKGTFLQMQRGHSCKCKGDIPANAKGTFLQMQKGHSCKCKGDIPANAKGTFLQMQRGHSCKCKGDIPANAKGTFLQMQRGHSCKCKGDIPANAKGTFLQMQRGHSCKCKGDIPANAKGTFLQMQRGHSCKCKGGISCKCKGNNYENRNVPLSSSTDTRLPQLSAALRYNSISARRSVSARWSMVRRTIK